MDLFVSELPVQLLAAGGHTPFVLLGVRAKQTRVKPLTQFYLSPETSKSRKHWVWAEGYVDILTLPQPR